MTVKITICPTAQRLLDKLHDDGFTEQDITNVAITENGGECIYVKCQEVRREDRHPLHYAGHGWTVLLAIQAAIARGSR